MDTIIKPEPLDKRRIQALTDATFAVAMTILILEIKVPKGLSLSAMKHYLSYETTSGLLIYFLSFITLGMFWIGTHYHHHLISKTDKISSWLNIFFLMFICVIPFSAGFINNYKHEPISIVFYTSNLILANFLHFFKLIYAWKKKYVKPHITKRQYANDRLRILIPICIYLVIIPISYISSFLALILFIVPFILHILPQKWMKQKIVYSDSNVNRQIS